MTLYFQLVIKDSLFALVSVENLIKKCRRLCEFANKSTRFYAEFYKQQEKQCDIFDKPSLKQDVETR